MTKHDDRKRRIRARMAKTGESYTTARARLIGTGEPATPGVRGGVERRAGDSDAVSVAFTEAKRLAVEGGAPQLAPVHLCAGLAASAGSIAQHALLEVGVTADECQRRIVFDSAAGPATGEVGLSVSARTVLEYAREALAGGWQHSEVAAVALGGGLVQVVRDGRLVWLPRPPLRTGHVLLGLLKEGSILRLLPRLDTPAVRDRVGALLATECELPPRWSSQPRFQGVPRPVREVLTDLDATEVREPASTGRGLYRDLATLLESLPPHRQAQPAIAVWHVAIHRVRQEIDAMATGELLGLTRPGLEGMFAAALNSDPTVIRARRWTDRQRSTSPSS